MFYNGRTLSFSVQKLPVQIVCLSHVLFNHSTSIKLLLSDSEIKFVKLNHQTRSSYLIIWLCFPKGKRRVEPLQFSKHIFFKKNIVLYL
jgi:hypothetical protein